MAQIIESLVNGILQPITELLDPIGHITATLKNSAPTNAAAQTQAVAQTTPVVTQANTQPANNPAATQVETQAVDTPPPAATTANGNGDDGGGGNAQTTTAAGGAGASPSPLSGNSVVSTTQGANAAVASSIANNNLAGRVSLTSEQSSYITLISTFTTTFSSPPKTLIEIIAIEEPKGHTTTITVTGTNTKYLTTTDTVTTSYPTSGAISSSKHRLSGGQIAGAVIGTLAGVTALIATAVFFLKRKKSRRISAYPEVGSLGYEKQVDHYSKQPLPPLPAEDRDSGQQLLDPGSPNSLNAAATAARKKLGLSKRQPRAHVLEWPMEFAAGGLGDDVHEGV